MIAAFLTINIRLYVQETINRLSLKNPPVKSSYRTMYSTHLPYPRTVPPPLDIRLQQDVQEGSALLEGPDNQSPAGN